MIRNLYYQQREIILYLIFGVMAFCLNVGLFASFHSVAGMNVLLANAVSWILTVLFAFFTNRIYVFQAGSGGLSVLFRQMLSFCSGRFFTLLVEEAILWLFISVLDFTSIPVKIAAQIVVVVLNYIISKWIVFSKKEEAVRES